MRDNRVKHALRAGGISVGTMMIEFNTSGIARIAAAAGAEFAVFDMEHSCWGMEEVRRLLAASRAADIVPLVRPPTSQYHFISRVLDAGAMGVVIPLVETAEQAREVVSWASYPPKGKRGCGFALAHDDFAGGDLASKMIHTNDNIMTIAQIETKAGLENVEAIAAVDGIDGLWVGQFDLTTSLGIPGDFAHRLFVDATRRVVKACEAHGKAAVLAVMDVDDLCAGPRNGYRMLVYAADLWIYQQALRRCFRAIGEANAPRGGASS
jgi:2-dehydro-3-deoxyglucarate aldolase/4-hydroxy-2-oxoheptanedioate aldolase